VGALAAEATTIAGAVGITGAVDVAEAGAAVTAGAANMAGCYMTVTSLKRTKNSIFTILDNCRYLLQPDL
jgi:ammonia channel protein AmtB